MKKIFAALLATALIIPGAAYAQSGQGNNQAQPTRSQNERSDRDDRDDRNGRGEPEQRNESRGNANGPDRSNANSQQRPNNANSSHARTDRHRFERGDHFDRSRASNYRRVNYTENRRLTAPPRGHVWVRSGDDALLVRLSNNLVTNIVTSIF